MYQRPHRNHNWKVYFKPFTPTEEFIPDNTNSGKISTFCFFIILGMITSVSLMAKVETKTSDIKPDNPIIARIQTIKKDLTNLENKNSFLESEILISNSKITQTLENKERKEVFKLAKLTANHTESGAGIILRINDKASALQQNENPNAGIVHNIDLLNTINVLWAGKAKAIAVNNTRITSLTGITCVGSTILVNNTRIAPPFIIKAVGNPETLGRILEKKIFQEFEIYGIKYSMEKFNKVEILADGNIILAGDN